MMQAVDRDNTLKCYQAKSRTTRNQQQLQAEQD